MSWYLTNLTVCHQRAKILNYQLGRSKMLGSSCADITSSLPVLLDLITSLSAIVEPTDTQKILDLKAKWITSISWKAVYGGGLLCPDGQKHLAFLAPGVAEEEILCERCGVYLQRVGDR